MNLEANVSNGDTDAHLFVDLRNKLPSFCGIVSQKKGKSAPLNTRKYPEVSRELRFQDFVTTAQDGGKVVSLTYRPHLPPWKYSRYSFLLEAESTLGP
jgi:hypothetical protein